MFQFQLINSILSAPKANWNALSENQSVFLQYDFLAALEQSASVSADTGWQPSHLLAYQDEELVGILPLYIKTHSYGEYVFDFAWADAYAQHGLNYYPKLVNAIPFTPVTGARICCAEKVNSSTLIEQALSFLKAYLTDSDCTSLHVLFPEKTLSDTLSKQGLPCRLSVQFQWFNRGYADFQQFLDSFTARRRKMVRKERNKIAAQAITVRRFAAEQINQQHMDFFYQCYQQTYLKRSGHTGYLTQDFFNRLLKTMQHSLLLVLAYQDEQPIAGALYLFDRGSLNGRYWGAIAEADGLHFECCYYQGIEFCIERGISIFNPGTQGEHKILRGFEPIFCYSNHLLKHVAFHQAVERFIKQETPSIELYKRNAESLLPYKQAQE